MHVSNVRQSLVIHVPFKCVKEHIGEKPYVCKHCDKTHCDCCNWFQIHERTHIGEKNDICKQCGESLSDSGPFAYVKRFIEERILSYLSTVVKPSAALLN